MNMPLAQSYRRQPSSTPLSPLTNYYNDDRNKNENTTSFSGQHSAHPPQSRAHSYAQNELQSDAQSYPSRTQLQPHTQLLVGPSSSYTATDFGNYGHQRPLYGTSVDLIEDTTAQHLRDQPHFHSGANLDLMPSEQSIAPTAWHFANAQASPSYSRGHHRESSLSSVGSAGPSSPYTQNTSYPQVLLPSDSATDIYYDGSGTTDSVQLVHHNYLKHEPYQPSALQQQYNSILDGDRIGGGPFSADPNYAAYMALQKRQTVADDNSNMAAPDYAHSSRPSVASTHDSPATPLPVEDFEEPGSRSKLELRNAASSIPKLDRTMSDAYNDELYSPSFAFSSAPIPRTDSTPATPARASDIFSQRLQAANNQHLSASSQVTADTSSRGRSPFRQGSPLAPTSNNFGSSPSRIRIGSAQQLREQKKAEHDARVLHEQLQHMSPPQAPPKTISPKDALLDYHETEDDASTPLFPSDGAQFTTRVSDDKSDLDDSASQQSFDSMATSRRPSSTAYSNSPQATPQAAFTFVPPSVPGTVPIPQQYPFVPAQRRQTSNMSSMTDRTPDFPSTLVSMESSSSEYTPDKEVKKPVATTADSGTYTCTYHGCTLRFESPAKLQRHKREGHRQSAPIVANLPSNGAAADAEASVDDADGVTSEALLRNSQAGPHKCERINPSTGKPCNTIFSRPYDLTRHEDTIHNARKQKVRCQLCTEEKTFSRNDALTRHMRVVHPEVDFPGKTRRRHD